MEGRLSVRVRDLSAENVAVGLPEIKLPTAPARLGWVRRRARRDLRTLAALIAGYVGIAYFLIPVWWRYHEREVNFRATPFVTRTGAGIPGDPVNLVLYGTREDVTRAMLAAGWHPADPVTWRTSLRISRSVALRQPYPEAPVSGLYLMGRRQDLAFQQCVGSSAKQRHHVRFWRTAETDEAGRPRWLGAATFDRSVGVSRRTGQVTHHIDADVDAERDKVLGDLRRAGQLLDSAWAPGLGPTRAGSNGGGDRYFTDGNLAVGVLTFARLGGGPE